MEQTYIRVLIVDDHAIVRKGLEATIQPDPISKWSPQPRLERKRCSASEKRSLM